MIHYGNDVKTCNMEAEWLVINPSGMVDVAGDSGEQVYSQGSIYVSDMYEIKGLPRGTVIRYDKSQHQFIFEPPMPVDT